MLDDEFLFTQGSDQPSHDETPERTSDWLDEFDILIPASQSPIPSQLVDSMLMQTDDLQQETDLLGWFDEVETSQLPEILPIDDSDHGAPFQANAQLPPHQFGNCLQSMQTSPAQSQHINDEDVLFFSSFPTDHMSPLSCPSSSESQQKDIEDDFEQQLLELDYPEQGSAKNREWVLQCIEKIFEDIADVLSGDSDKNQLELKVKVRNSRAKDAQRFDPITKSIRNGPQFTTRSLRFPGKTAGEAWKFAALLRVLDLIFEAIIEEKVVTKRDIYYKDVALFKRQGVVDAIVDDIAYTFGVKRSELNVFAAAKGLVCGQIQLWSKGGNLIDCSKQQEGILIPNIQSIERVDFLDTQWILVIEKEATFRYLASTRFWDHSAAGKGILITGKGYPDISTREFLRFLSLHTGATIQASVMARNMPSEQLAQFQTEVRVIHRRTPKIFALVDYDPHGLNILSVYKNGSVSLAHENHRLVVSDLGYLGVKSRDLPNFQDHIAGTGMGFENEPLRLTEKDRRKAVIMLGKECIWAEQEWRSELQHMLFFNMKAEIQAMDLRKKYDGGGFLAYLEKNLIEGHTQ